MTTGNFLCVDCDDDLKKISTSSVTLFYCCNRKCRRFGVITIGGLAGDTCDKKIILEQEKADK